MEMRCYHRILRISYKDHVTNKEVCAKIQQAVGPHKDPLTIVKKRKLQWYGHVSRSSGLAKTILQGTVKGGRRQGRQRKKWEDNIREWTGLDFVESQRAVENREKWRKLVAISSMVPHRPLQLRDRWWWWWAEYCTCRKMPPLWIAQSYQRFSFYSLKLVEIQHVLQASPAAGTFYFIQIHFFLVLFFSVLWHKLCHEQ